MFELATPYSARGRAKVSVTKYRFLYQLIYLSLPRSEHFGPGPKITILCFSVTRQTALPIRIVQRFCARGYGWFEKLLYHRRNPSRWDRTDAVAKFSMLRLNICSGILKLSSCMLWLSLTSSVQGGNPSQARGTVPADLPHVQENLYLKLFCKISLQIQGAVAEICDCSARGCFSAAVQKINGF